MATVECIKCEWCDKLTIIPRSTDIPSPRLHLYEANKSGKDFCNRECLVTYLDRNPSIGVSN